MSERKKLKLEKDRYFREKGDDALKMDENALMGGDDSFFKGQ